MDMDLAIKTMGWLIGAFAAVMLSLGHVMSGDGSTGFKVLQAEEVCKASGAVGVTIDNELHHLCGRRQ